MTEKWLVTGGAGFIGGNFVLRQVLKNNRNPSKPGNPINTCIVFLFNEVSVQLNNKYVVQTL